MFDAYSQFAWQEIKDGKLVGPKLTANFDTIPLGIKHKPATAQGVEIVLVKTLFKDGVRIAESITDLEMYKAMGECNESLRALMAEMTKAQTDKASDAHSLNLGGGGFAGLGDADFGQPNNRLKN